MMRRMLLSVVAATVVAVLPAQQRFGFAYYDVDRLCDTLPSMFYDDSRYLPDGALRWTAERYERKVSQVAALLDSMKMPVVALYGVESEDVVRDIVLRSDGDYSYIHRTFLSPLGEDFALLYYGDVLFPSRVESGRNVLVVEAAVGGADWAFVLVRRAADISETVASLRSRNPRVAVVAAGDLRGVDFGREGLVDVTSAAAAAGRGNVLTSEGWRFYDRIAVDRAVESGGDVFARRWLLDRKGAPAATYEGSVYAGGPGRRLPVFCHIVQKID